MVAMLRPLAPLIIYYANYDYIAEELCENRDRPYLECNGKCYLNAMMERLDLPTENQKPKSTVPLNMNDYPISTLDFYAYKSSEELDNKELSTPIFNKHFVISEYSETIFHPPKLVA